MKLPIKIYGHKCELPTTWEDLTFKQYYELEAWRIEDGEDLVKLASILLNKPYNWLCQVEGGGFDEVILPNMLWLSAGDLNLRALKFKSEIMIQGHKLIVPKNLGLETWGQKIKVEQEFVSITARYAHNVLSKDQLKSASSLEIRNHELSLHKIAYQQMSFLVAVYLYPKYYNREFNLQEARAFQQILVESSLFDMWPVADFFFRKLNGSGFLKRIFRKVTRKATT